MNSQLQQTLLVRIQSESPKSLLILAPEVPLAIQEYLNGNDQIHLTYIKFDQTELAFSKLGRIDFAVVFGLLGSLTKEAAIQVITRLRDLHARLLWVLVSEPQLTDAYTNRDAVAQGLKLVNPEQFGKCNSCWYEFSLHSYKPVPQWLNARNWAHPEKWDKQRW